MGIAGNGAVEAIAAAPPRVGLIASARELSRVDETDATGYSDANPKTRWMAGFSWSPENACDAGGVLDPCDDDPDKEAGTNAEARLYDPVVLWAPDTCTTRGVRDRVGRAKRRLAACTSKLLANDFWMGTTAIARSMPNAYLTKISEMNILTTSAKSPTDALACLEEALADCSCGTTMIHASPNRVTHWKALTLVERSGNTLRTINDTIVVADAGYTGAGPGGTPATNGHVWAYGTDLVFVRLGGIDVIQATALEENTTTYRAERMAAATFDGCCHVAAEVNINICDSLASS